MMRLLLKIMCSMGLVCLLTNIHASPILYKITCFQDCDTNTQCACHISLPSNRTAQLLYTVTNQSTHMPHTLVMGAIPGVTQITQSGTIPQLCSNPIVLNSMQTCTLALSVNGAQLQGNVTEGPIICDYSAGPCYSTSPEGYRPDPANSLSITVSPAATISVSGSPLTLLTFGEGVESGELTVTNTSTNVTATNIHSNFTGTVLDGEVIETGNTCANLAPLASCTLTFTPSGVVLPLTDFPIAGDNTNTVIAQIRVIFPDSKR